jgi:hypothetical protein
METKQNDYGNWPIVDGKVIPPITVNGYKIVFNEFWGTYQCSLDGVIYAEFNKVGEAIEYCNKG